MIRSFLPLKLQPFLLSQDSCTVHRAFSLLQYLTSHRHHHYLLTWILSIKHRQSLVTKNDETSSEPPSPSTLWSRQSQLCGRALLTSWVHFLTLFSPTAAWLPSPPPRKELRVSLLISSLVLHPKGRLFRPCLTSERASRFTGHACLLPPLPWCHISSLHPASVLCPSSNSLAGLSSFI